MKIHVAQIYVEPGTSFPFSHLWQRWMSAELSARAVPSKKFVTKYGDDFELMIRISAKKKLTDNEVRGPSIFRKQKDVEYTLFLPYDVIIEAPNGCRVAMEFILRGIVDIFAAAHIDAKGLEAQQLYLIDHACSDPSMFEKPWPERRSSMAN